MEVDITVLCIKMEDASTFTTAVTPKHIIADLDIHMSLPICTEWTPAMQLSPGISYDFDAKKIKRYGLHSLRMALSGNNLIFWSRYSGVDPEHSASGFSPCFDSSQTPRSRSFTFSINVGF